MKFLCERLAGVNINGGVTKKKKVKTEYEKLLDGFSSMNFTHDYQALYRKKNRKKLNINAKVRVPCKFCGKYFSKSNKTHHMRTKFCKKAQKAAEIESLAAGLKKVRF